MKKIKLAFASIAAAALLLVSCSSDDDNSIAASLEGRWTPIKTLTVVSGNESVQNYQDNEEGCDKDYREFLAGGTYRFVVLYKNASEVCTEDTQTSTYTKSGDFLTINPGVEESGTYEITKLTGTELRYQSTANVGGIDVEVTQVFKRV